MNIPTVSILTDLKFNEQKPAVTVLMDTPASKEVRITFKNGQVMKEHQAPHPIVVNVVEGEVEFFVDEKMYLLEKGMMIALDSNVLHELKANKESIVRLSIHKAS